MGGRRWEGGGGGSFEEEKQSCGGSFGREEVCRGPGDSKMLSSYGGIEKEKSDILLHGREQEPRRGGGRPPRTWNGVVHRPCAGIHDGPDAEVKLHEKYQLCEVLGVGSTSTCHRCVDLLAGASRACKVSGNVILDPKCQGRKYQFYTEIKALRGLRHPNIIQLFDVFVTKDKIYIMMELMSGGELFDYVAPRGVLTEEEASGIVRKVTSALVYMHSKNVIHRDIKPNNLLLARKPRNSHDIEVKIIDFGLSKILSDSPMTGTFLGTRGYLAPEIIQRRDYTKSVDAWALGVVAFVLLGGCLPFDDDCQPVPAPAVLQTKFALRFPWWAKDLSASARDLLGHLLEIDPCRRYTAEQAMAHPWVRGETASRQEFPFDYAADIPIDSGCKIQDAAHKDRRLQIY